MAKFAKGQIVWIVESNYRILEAKVISNEYGMYLLKLTETGGALRLKEHRLYATEEEAQAEIDRIKRERR